MDEEKVLPKATIQAFIKQNLGGQKFSGDFVDKINEIAGRIISLMKSSSKIFRQMHTIFV